MLRWILFVLVMGNAFGYDPDSAVRDLETDYTVYEKRASEELIQNRAFASRSALRSATLYNPEKLPMPMAWKDEALLQERFELIRDKRFLKRNNVLRRSSWLYPDDGCYARAALAVKNLFSAFAPLPNKVFAFGNLRVKTSNSTRGRVGWWYHVAPIVSVNGVRFVLDPAIEPSRPLELSEWLSRMGTPEKIKVSICGSGTYTPGTSCARESNGIERQAERTQLRFLDLEWKRLGSLGRNREEELGEEPPWLSP